MARIGGRLLDQVHLEARVVVPGPLPSFRFTLDDLPLVSGAFRDVRVEKLENAFLLPTTDAALAWSAR